MWRKEARSPGNWVEEWAGSREHCGPSWGLPSAHTQPPPAGPHPAWFPQGSFKELTYVFFMLKDAGLAPDLQSYAAALQCMGRLDQDAGTIRRWVGRCRVAWLSWGLGSLGLPGHWRCEPGVCALQVPEADGAGRATAAGALHGCAAERRGAG